MEETPILNEHNKAEFPPAHSAEHILNQAMVRMFGCSRSRVNHIERKKSKCNYDLPTCPTEEQIRKSIHNPEYIKEIYGEDKTRR